MQRFWIQGVVKNGQVVLETPLDLPDGTVVTVTKQETATDMSSRSEADKRKRLELLNRLDLLDDPDWEAKIEADWIAACEQLIRDAESLRANCSEIPPPEQWMCR